MYRRLFKIFILTVLSSSSFAQKDLFKVMHPTCDLKIKSFNKSNKFLKDIFLDKIKERGFKPGPMKDDKRLFSGDLYLNLTLKRPKDKLYRSCSVVLVLRQAKNNKIANTDVVLFKRESKRTLPRVTFSGDERCKRALKDAFIHIPPCKSSGP